MTTTLIILSSSAALIFILWKWEVFRYDLRRLSRNTSFLPPEETVFSATDWSFYHQLLLDHNMYYKALSQGQQEKFMKRVKQFMYYKEFKYINISPDPFIPLLISSAAIQLTFGLKDFRLDFFDKIIVVNTAYKMNRHQQDFEGHVNLQGIYISWEHLVKGYNNYQDADNVGIHEMAHALTYGYYNGYTSMDSEFREHFDAFQKVAEPVFSNMRNGMETVLDIYAVTNFQEFWAVSVETFFEKPLQLKVTEPVLYNSLCNLLNQDPLLLQAGFKN